MKTFLEAPRIISVHGRTSFLVTNLAEFEQQPVLKEILSEYSYKDESAYRLYDLKQKQP